MTSWRDSASQQAQADLDGLLGPSLGFAQQQLDKFLEFYPYAVVVAATGEQRMVTGDIGKEQPASADVITALIATLAEQREQLRAVAIVADVRLPDLESDAIRVTLEHAEGVTLAVALPYRLRRFGRGVDYGDPRAGEALPFIWPG